MKILITGISGFLGNYLFNNWTSNDFLWGITQSNTPINNNLNFPLYNISELDKIEQPDVVIMCHAVISNSKTKASNENLFEGNVLYTEKIRRKFPQAYFIYTSTVSVYSQEEERITEESSIKPSNGYSISKYWGELTFKDSNAGIIRFSSLYGNGMTEGTIIPNYVNMALDKNVIEVWGNGSRMQNYLHIKDAKNYIEALAVKKLNGIFLGINSVENSNIELAKIVSEKTGAEIRFINEDNSVSVKYNNEYTLSKLNMSPGVKFSKGTEDYIVWKQKQF
ncbi:MAG: NAD(P)-dependent oxidoreductase [Bacteroidota bacterium]